MRISCRCEIVFSMMPHCFLIPVMVGHGEEEKSAEVIPASISGEDVQVETKKSDSSRRGSKENDSDGKTQHTVSSRKSQSSSECDLDKVVKGFTNMKLGDTKGHKVIFKGPEGKPENSVQNSPTDSTSRSPINGLATQVPGAYLIQDFPHNSPYQPGQKRSQRITSAPVTSGYATQDHNKFTRPSSDVPPPELSRTPQENVDNSEYNLYHSQWTTHPGTCRYPVSTAVSSTAAITQSQSPVPSPASSHYYSNHSPMSNYSDPMSPLQHGNFAINSVCHPSQQSAGVPFHTGHLQADFAMHGQVQAYTHPSQSHQTLLSPDSCSQFTPDMEQSFYLPDDALKELMPAGGKRLWKPSSY